MTWGGVLFIIVMGLVMLSWIKRRGPLRLLLSAAVCYRAVLFAAADFARAGMERVSRRWPEYLQRAREEL